MGSLIMPYKINDCSVCGDKNTEVRKRGKDYICIRCCKEIDTKKQAQRVAEKTKVRGLNNVQRSNGNESAADRANVIQDLDYTFSRIIRLREVDERGFCSCFTCDVIKHWTMQQCGHYCKRSNTLLRWDLRAAKVQCPNCNCNKHGNMEVFTERLEAESPGLPEQLNEEAKEVNKYTLSDLKELLIDLRQKLRILEKTKLKK